MSRIEDLLALADAALARSEIIGEDAWYCESEFRAEDGFSPADARFIVACHPATIRAMCEALQAAQEVVNNTAQAFVEHWDGVPCDIAETLGISRLSAALLRITTIAVDVKQRREKDGTQ